jgi:hypothetical protein
MPKESTEKSAPVDIASRADKMSRGSSILYKNKNPKNATASHYRGVLKLEDGRAFWVGLWVRQVNGERALEIRLAPKL